MTQLDQIKIAYRDFPWVGDPSRFLFTRVLASQYEVVISDDPDFTFFSCWGKRHLLDRGVKIFFSPENYGWDFTTCDFAITSDHVDDPRHYRLPVYTLWGRDPTPLVKVNVDPEAVLREKTEFCNFVYSNRRPSLRDEFFEKLSRYKRVDSGGGHLNNLGYRVDDKFEFIRRYKFTIAFENASHPGYTTEKLTDPMLVNSLPLYWGNPVVEKDFNVSSFVFLQDLNLDDFIERVIAIDQDPDLYARYIAEPWFHDNRPNNCYDLDRLLEWFHPIVNQDPVLVSPSARTRLAYTTWWINGPAFLAVRRWIQGRPRAYRLARRIWRATRLRRAWASMHMRIHRFRPETPGSEPKRPDQ